MQKEVLSLLCYLFHHLVMRGQGYCWQFARDEEDSRVTNNSKEECRGWPREHEELFITRRSCICCLDVKNVTKKKSAFNCKICRYECVHWRLWAAASPYPPSISLLYTDFGQRFQIRKKQLGLTNWPVAIMVKWIHQISASTRYKTQEANNQQLLDYGKMTAAQ